MTDFEKFKEELMAKNMNIFLMIGKKIEIETMKDYHGLY